MENETEDFDMFSDERFGISKDKTRKVEEAISKYYGFDEAKCFMCETKENLSITPLVQNPDKVEHNINSISNIYSAKYSNEAVKKYELLCKSCRIAKLDLIKVFLKTENKDKQMKLLDMILTFIPDKEKEATKTEYLKMLGK